MNTLKKSFVLALIVSIVSFILLMIIPGNISFKAEFGFDQKFYLFIMTLASLGVGQMVFMFRQYRLNK